MLTGMVKDEGSVIAVMAAVAAALVAYGYYNRYLYEYIRNNKLYAKYKYYTDKFYHHLVFNGI